MNSTQQTEALIFANDRPSAIDDDLYQWAIDAEDLIRHQHARIADLEAQLSAIGADGVEPLRKQAVPETLVVPDGYALMPIEPTTGICKPSGGWGFMNHIHRKRATQAAKKGEQT